MTEKSSTNLDNFTAKIDSAIDDLFTPKRNIQIDPLTNEIKEEQDLNSSPAVSAVKNTEVKAPPPQETKAPSTDPPTPTEAQALSEKQPRPEVTALLSRLDQSFLTIDWEITREGVSTFQALLNDVNKTINPPEGSGLNTITGLMDKILSTLADSPESLPTTTVKSLQKGILLFKDFAENQEEREDLRPAASVLIKELQTILKHTTNQQHQESADSGDQTEPEFGDDLMASELIPDIPEIGIPLKLSNQINLHLTILAQCVNRILPLEKLFGQNEDYEHYLNEHRELREMLEEEKDTISTALNTDYSHSPLNQENKLPELLCESIKTHVSKLEQAVRKISPIEQLAKQKGATKLHKVEKEIRQQLEDQATMLNNTLSAKGQTIAGSDSSVPANLRDVFESHVGGIGKCIKQIIPLENLFGKTKGYEKLHAVQKRIRVQLELQQKQLTQALKHCPTGPESVQAQRPAQPSDSPWPKLIKTRHQGQEIFLIPEEVSITNTASFQKALKKGAGQLFLKRLKKWPWSKLKTQVHGELANFPEEQLNAMTIPPLFSGHEASTSTKNEEMLIVLFADDKGAWLLTDAAIEEFQVTEEWQWRAATNDGVSKECGFLNRQGISIPVLSIR